MAGFSLLQLLAWTLMASASSAFSPDIVGQSFLSLFT